jgi:hypothetical protein
MEVTEDGGEATRTRLQVDVEVAFDVFEVVALPDQQELAGVAAEDVDTVLMEREPEDEMKGAPAEV